MSWVSNVCCQALNGPLSVHSGSGGKAQECKHGQAAVLELLDSLLRLPSVQGVEGEERQETSLQAQMGTEVKNTYLDTTDGSQTVCPQYLLEDLKKKWWLRYVVSIGAEMLLINNKCTQQLCWAIATF